MAKSRSIARELALSEITFRKYERPGKLSERELVRKVCLSLGLLQPGDSRDVIVDILCVLLRSRKQKIFLQVNEIEKKIIHLRKKQKLALAGIAPSNIRRQLRRLKESYLVEKDPRGYRICEFEAIDSIFENKILKVYVDDITKRVLEYCKRIG